MCTCDQNSQDGGAARPTPSAPMSRGLEDALCLAMMAGLLSTFVQSLMSHMSNSSANQQASIAAGSHSAITGLATVARAVDQILGDDQPSPPPQAPHPGPGPMFAAQATQQGPFAQPLAVT